MPDLLNITHPPLLKKAALCVICRNIVIFNGWILQWWSGNFTFERPLWVWQKNSIWRDAFFLPRPVIVKCGKICRNRFLANITSYIWLSQTTILIITAVSWQVEPDTWLLSILSHSAINRMEHLLKIPRSKVFTEWHWGQCIEDRNGKEYLFVNRIWETEICSIYRYRDLNLTIALCF